MGLIKSIRDIGKGRLYIQLVGSGLTIKSSELSLAWGCFERWTPGEQLTPEYVSTRSCVAAFKNRQPITLTALSAEALDALVDAVSRVSGAYVERDTDVVEVVAA